MYFKAANEHARRLWYDIENDTMTVCKIQDHKAIIDGIRNNRTRKQFYECRKLSGAIVLMTSDNPITPDNILNMVVLVQDKLDELDKKHQRRESKAIDCDFVAWLNSEMAFTGVTLTELARQTGYSMSTLSKIRNGKRGGSDECKATIRRYIASKAARIVKAV